MKSTPFFLKTSDFTPAEILAVAEVHQREIEAGFLSSLGRTALALIYDHVGRSTFSRLIIARDGDRIAGIIAGSVDTGKLYRDFLRKRGLRALWVFAPRLLRGSRLRKAIETLRYPGRATQLPAAEILNFAVEPEYRGSGVAQELFRELRDYFAANGIGQIKIVTGKSQTRAQSFYEKMGARPVGDIMIHKGESSLTYVYDVGAPGVTSPC